MIHTLRRASAWLVLGPIWMYRRLVSPLLPRTCRYYPSCSVYAEQAIRIHGPVRGSWLAIKRLGRCHPWTPGGVDHVPPGGSTSPTAPVMPDSSTTVGPTTPATPATGV
jgi:putative membrane protein insertion efficiency factor